LAGQIPNVYLPIEVHSKLPFQSYLPKPLAEWYLKKLSTVPWKHNGMIGFELARDNLKMIALKQSSSKWKSQSKISLLSNPI
jgi:hypothetical protein